MKIISDGTPEGTKVFIANTPIDDITKIIIHPIEPNDGLIKAELTFINVELDMIAKPINNETSINNEEHF